MARNNISNLIRANSKDLKKTALQLYSGEVLTYGELIAFQDQAQIAIRNFSIQLNVRIALVSNHHLVYPSLLLAIMEEATCVPLDYDWNFEEYQKYYQLLGVDYLMCDRTAEVAIAAAIASGIGIMEFCPDKPGKPALLHFNLSPGEKTDHREGKNDQTAIIFTTSGTTSLPKVVPRLYHDIYSALQIEAKNLEFTEQSFHLVATQLFRFPTIWIMLKVFMTNGSMVYLDGINPKRITEAIMNLDITHAYLPPAGLVSLNDYADNNAFTYESDHLMLLVVYGAPLPYQVKDRIEKRFNAILIDVYGMTEIGITTTTHQTPKGYRAGSVGYPLAQQIKIVDDEILVKGVGVFNGYENNPEVNRDSFIDGWFRTGDVGYVDEDGYLFIQSRIREMINRGGEKVSPFEIEEAILSLGNIQEVCIFPYPNSQGSDEVGAVIVPKLGLTIGLRNLRHALKDKIRAFKLPILLYTVEEIPRSAASKVQRKFLFQQLQDLNHVPETLKNVTHGSTSELTYTQAKIAEIWKNILQQNYIGLDDIFFDLGGDSLSAAEVLAAIEASLGCVLPISEFFQKSTVRQLADLVEATPKFNPYKHIVPIRLGGSKIPVFFIHDRSGDNITYHLLVEHLDQERPVYGLNFNWQKESWNEATSINEVARAYVDEVQMVRKSGPYYLIGLSVGGEIAFAMGPMLTDLKSEAVIFMIDTFSERTLRNYRIKRVRRLFKESLSNFGQTPINRIPQLALKKADTMYRQFFPAKMKLRASAINHAQVGSDLLSAKSEATQNTTLLDSIRKNFRPSRFTGKVCYFRALDKDPNNSSYLHWQALTDDFTLFERECSHVDFVKPKYVGYTARKINEFLETYEKSLEDGSI